MFKISTAVEASAVVFGERASIFGGLGSFFAFVAKIDVIAWGSLFVAVVGLFIQLCFAIARNRREKVEHELKKDEYRLRIENLKGECNAEQN